MALVLSSNHNVGEEKPRRSSFRAEKKPWMLRDYLRDDMSSCSSNGFKSFPRRQCCVAVKNIIEKEVTKTCRNNTPLKTPKMRNRSVSSVLQRASLAVINAVKLLPFNSAGEGTSGGRLLPRSFSKKIFKRSFFWKKRDKTANVKVVVVGKEKKGVEECDEIERWISSGVVGMEKYQPLDLSNDTTVTNASTTSNSNSNSSDGKSSDSWSDITFTSDYLTSVSENDVVERRGKVVGRECGGGGGEEEVVSGCGGVLACDDSVEPAVTKFVKFQQNIWSNVENEKEQFSPISVMEFPYNDEEGSASPFTLRVTRLKGTTERLMKKLGRFESMAAELGLEPVNLESLVSSTEMEEQSPKHSILTCTTPSFILSSESETEEDEEESPETEAERRVQHLLSIVKFNLPSNSAYKFDQDSLLLDFFRENITQKADYTLLKAVEDWINGHYDKLILGWEVKDKREAYIRDMEEGERWPKDTKVEKEEVASELGVKVLEDLIEEVMVEFQEVQVRKAHYSLAK